MIDSADASYGAKESTYQETKAISAMQFSAAAYCKYETLDMWQCGPHCQGNQGFKEVKRLYSSNSHTFGYTGYDTATNRIVVAFRGTNGPDLANWSTNFDGKLTPYPFLPTGKAHNGFLSAFKEVQEQMRANLRELQKNHLSASYLITGHSLGGALATLAALDIYFELAIPPSRIEVYTFGQPRAVDDVLSNEMMALFPDNFHRVTHYDDAVVHIPIRYQGFKHVGEEIWYPDADFTKGKFKVCSNEYGKDENVNCSQTIIFKTGIPAHVKYLGIQVGDGCFEKQPSGTLLDKFLW